MQTIYNIAFWVIVGPLLIILASVAIPIAFGLVFVILAIILGLSIFALPVLSALYLVKKVI